MATNGMEPQPAAQRMHMVNGQLRTSDVTDLSVLGAFLDVPRERFVAPALAQLAYVDQDLPAAGGAGRRLLAPRTLALLLQAAAIARTRARRRGRFRLQRRLARLPRGFGGRARIGSGRGAVCSRGVGGTRRRRGRRRRARVGGAGKGAIRRDTRQRRLRDDAARIAGPTLEWRPSGRRGCAHGVASRGDHRQIVGRLQRALAVRRQGRCPCCLSTDAGIRVLIQARPITDIAALDC
jgi:hypothetical protein